VHLPTIKTQILSDCVDETIFIIKIQYFHFRRFGRVKLPFSREHKSSPRTKFN